MRKLLTIFGAVGAVSLSSSCSVSCKPDLPNYNYDKNIGVINISADKDNKVSFGEVYTELAMSAGQEFEEIQVDYNKVFEEYKDQSGDENMEDISVVTSYEGISGSELKLSPTDFVDDNPDKLNWDKTIANYNDFKGLVVKTDFGKDKSFSFYFRLTFSINNTNK